MMKKLIVLLLFLTACPSSQTTQTDTPTSQPTTATLGQPCAGFGNIQCGDGMECYLAEEEQKMDDANGVCVATRAKVGETCGGLGNVKCRDDGFCKYEDVGTLDGNGTCEARPTQCEDIAMDPMPCGINGVRYATECHANMAGFDIAPENLKVCADST
jgi:hypothetical protein